MRVRWPRRHRPEPRPPLTPQQRAENEAISHLAEYERVHGITGGEVGLMMMRIDRRWEALKNPPCPVCHDYCPLWVTRDDYTKGLVLGGFAVAEAIWEEAAR